MTSENARRLREKKEDHHKNFISHFLLFDVKQRETSREIIKGEWMLDGKWV